MSERGALRIVVEGADAHRFHDRLMGFVTQSESNPETRVEDPEGELYWVVSDDGAEDNISIDCYSFDSRFQRIQVIDWDGESVPEDWDKDWDNLSFEERIALCDGFGVIYIATQVE